MGDIRDGGGSVPLSERRERDLRGPVQGTMILKERAAAPAGGGGASGDVVPLPWFLPGERNHLAPSPPASAGPLSLLPPSLMMSLTWRP